MHQWVPSSGAVVLPGGLVYIRLKTPLSGLTPTWPHTGIEECRMSTGVNIGIGVVMGNAVPGGPGGGWLVASIESKCKG